MFSQELSTQRKRNKRAKTWGKKQQQPIRTLVIRKKKQTQNNLLVSKQVISEQNQSWERTPWKINNPKAMRKHKKNMTHTKDNDMNTVEQSKAYLFVAKTTSNKCNEFS